MKMKHAFLLMIHKNLNQVKLLLKLLDHEQNHFYIHCDQKSSLSDHQFKDAVQHSQLFFLPRMDIRWGSYTQIECTLNLLKASLPQQYGYYHLISGQDLPLKPVPYIHQFFANHQGTNFIHFTDIHDPSLVHRRVGTYTVMNEHSKFTERFNYYFYLLQKCLRVNRVKNSPEFHYGANWFSITHELASYVIDSEPWIGKTFSHSICGDELYLQTLAANSHFHSSLYLSKKDGCLQNLRYVDWKRGDGKHPHMFEASDFEELIHSGCLFARKFDQETSPEIIRKIYQHLTKA